MHLENPYHAHGSMYGLDSDTCPDCDEDRDDRGRCPVCGRDAIDYGPEDEDDREVGS